MDSTTTRSSSPSNRRGLRALGIALGYAGCAVATVALVGGVWFHRMDFAWLEVFGFVTGMWGVWLQARESHWNWPVQLISSAVYVGVFFQARLYADTTLNLLDVALYGLGWYWWLRGGARQTRLDIGHLTWRLAGLLTLVGVAGSAVMTVFLYSVHDAAPVLDATTTVASLIATFIMGRKLLESWHLWIVVNLVYIALYCVRGLYLTAILYGLFAIFSVVGLIGWQRHVREAAALEAPAAAQG